MAEYLGFTIANRHIDPAECLLLDFWTTNPHEHYRLGFKPDGPPADCGKWLAFSMAKTARDKGFELPEGLDAELAQALETMTQRLK